MSACCKHFPRCDHEYGIGVQRNEKGFPLDEEVNIDWGRTSEEKQDYEKTITPKSKRATNYTPPKKKRKKR